MFPLSKGRVTRQAHVGLPEGTFEEEHGREAFDGRASHLYRSHPPTAWIRIEGPLRPRAYDLTGLKPPDQADAAGEWQRILSNEDVSIFVSKRTEPSPPRNWWFQNRSTLMPFSARNRLRFSSLARRSGNPCPPPSSSTASFATVQ